jgi:PAS domain S-box-containing protein
LLNEFAGRLEAIIETAIDGIITINDIGIVETMNNSAAEIFQYDTYEVIGQNIKMLMPEPDRSQHDDYLKKYKETKRPKIIGVGRDVIGLKKDGTEFPFRLAVSEVFLNDRIIYTGIVHDLSEVSKVNAKLKKVNDALEIKVEERTEELENAINKLLNSNKQLAQREEALESALTKEKELNELKSRFVSMASHEFRTPLSTIMSSAALLARYTETDQQSKREKHINRIKSSVANLTGILNDFLSLSKLEEGKIEEIFELVNIEELCESIYEELEGILKPNQKIEHFAHREIKKIKSDKRILKNILFNMISNAVKYSESGDTIRCNIHYNEDNVKIDISDEGIGIPENEQKYLFERFFRASNAETIQGTGLGLHIVKQYLNRLNGNISFKSEDGLGTTFTITLPYSV